MSNILLPRVSEILEGAGLVPSFSNVPPEVLKHAADRGTAVHKAIELHLKDTLDPESIDSECLPYFEAFLDWEANCRATDPSFEIIETEMQVETDTFRGTLDLLCCLKGRSTVVDFKTSSKVHPHAKAQLGGYILGAEWKDEYAVEAAAVLHLRKNGSYKLHPYEYFECTNLFEAALIIFDFRCENGLYRLPR